MSETTQIVNTTEEQHTVARRSRLFRIIQALERSPAVSYIVDSSHRIIHCNPAWDIFANKNGAPQLTAEQVIGLDIFAVIPDVLKNFYFDVLHVRGRKAYGSSPMNAQALICSVIIE